MRTFGYGVLFSHAFAQKVSGNFGSHSAADRYGRDVCDAQPGVECEVMYYDETQPDWRSVEGDETASDVIQRRWAS